MPELIIDSILKDFEGVAFQLLKKAGLDVKQDSTCVNVILVEETDIAKVEEILTANSIEFQWSVQDEEDADDRADIYDEGYDDVDWEGSGPR